MSVLSKHIGSGSAANAISNPTSVQHFEGPTSAGAGLQQGNRQSGSFVFNTKDLSPNKPTAYSKLTNTSIYGANEGKETASPVKPLGATQ